MNKDEIKNYAGQDSFRRAPKMPFYPILGLQGNNGEFELMTKKGEKVEKEVVEKEITLVILRVRRRLTDFSTSESSTEHNGSNDNTTIFVHDNETRRTTKLDEGVSSVMKERHPELSVQQILYSVYKGEIVRLLVKGGSLGSQNEPAGSVPLYDYLASYKRNNDEHIWLYETVLTPIQKKNTKMKKTYYAISFSRGRELADEELNVVGDYMKELHDLFKEQDEYNGIFTNTIDARSKMIESKQRQIKEEVDQTSDEGVPSVQLEEDEIKPEEIPF